jgi:hypothetical protein
MRTVNGNDGHRAIAFDQHAVGLGHVRRPPFCFEEPIAFSSEVGTGSREENASKQESRASVLIQSEPIML